MSRIAKKVIIVPSNVCVTLINQLIIVKGNYGKLKKTIHKSVQIDYVNSCLTFKSRIDNSTLGWAQAGTARSIINSMIIGVTEGFSKKLQLVGVGYKIVVGDNLQNLEMSLGFSHNINYVLPKGITAENVSQVEIIIKGIDKELVGQVAAKLRAYRKPEPYKGKGIRYINEIIRVKEAKKK